MERQESDMRVVQVCHGDIYADHRGQSIFQTWTPKGPAGTVTIARFDARQGLFVQEECSMDEALSELKRAE